MRSNLLSYEPILELPVGFLHLSSGGDEGIRTLDPLLAGQVLSQLSYTPALLRFGFRCPLCFEGWAFKIEQY